jgi:hypothetical protein
MTRTFKSERPQIKWTQRVADLPHCKEVHMAFTALGDLSQERDDAKAIQKKLGAATKAGLDAIKSAQEGFDEPRFKV